MIEILKNNFTKDKQEISNIFRSKYILTLEPII